MDPFTFEHSFRFTEERFVELCGVFRKKTRPLRVAAAGAAGLACLFSPYTLVAGILLLGLAVFGTFLLRWIPKSAVHGYRNTPYLQDELTYGIDDRGLWLAGPPIEARVPWKAARVWDRREGWLRISAPGAPWFWFPVAALKEAGLYNRVMERGKQHAVRFNSGETKGNRR